MGEKITQVLRDVNLNLQTGSLKERRQVIQNIVDILEKPEINDNFVKGICRLLPLTLHRYTDGSSQALLRHLIAKLVHGHPNVAIGYLAEVILALGEHLRNLVATESTSQTALFILKWTSVVVQTGWNCGHVKTHISEIVNAQASLLTAIVACGNSKRSQKGFQLLNNLWMTVPESEIFYLNTLSRLEQNQCTIVLASALVRTLSSKPVPSTEYLDNFFEAFLKNFITVKIAPSPHVVKACFPLLEIANHDHLKKIIPALQKSILRSPEVVIEVVGLVLKGINSDLNYFAKDIGSGLISNLYSKDEKTRNNAIIGCRYLAEKISQKDVLEELLNNVFQVYHGSNGKLTVPEYKIGVLKGAGNFSFNAVPKENFEILSESIVKHFVKVIESEVHEKTICIALEALSLWSCRLTKVPKTILDSFKNGINTKTPLVKISYIQCALATFNDENISQISQLVSLLEKSVEKAVSQSTQPLTVCEGLCAALLLLRIKEKSKDNGFSNVWNTVFDMEKQVFVSDKFLSLAGENNLVYVVQFCKMLLLTYSNKICKRPESLYKSILYCCLYSDVQTRKDCLKEVDHMLKFSKSPEIAKALLNELQKMLDNDKLNNIAENAEKENNASGTIHAVVDCLRTLCSFKSLNQEDAEIIAIAALLPTHNQNVIAVAPKLWLKSVKRFVDCSVKDFIARIADQLTQIFVEEYKASKTYENVLATLLDVHSDVVLPNLIFKVSRILKDSRFCEVTKDDYFTFLTPNDELYDKSVIPGSDSNKEVNLKRESKAYSYKEQLEELQLRREIEEKKNKEGKTKFPQYTPKQLDAIKNQKLKEQGIRQRVTELNVLISNAVSMIYAASKGNPVKLSLHYKDLLPLVLQNFQSPLTAPYLTKLFVDLRKTVFSKDMDFIAELISHVILRLSAPQCDIDSNWKEENLNKAMVRTIGLLHRQTVAKKSEENENKERQHHTLTAPAFSYIFPLLKLGLTSNYAKLHEELMFQGLQIISKHAKPKGDDKDGKTDLYHPKYLPIQQVFILLLEIISTASGRIQSQAEACFLDVSNCVSGKSGSAEAGNAEVDVLLEALQSPTVVVRDAALRSLIIISSALALYNDMVKLTNRLWVARFDENEENRILAEQLWTLCNMNIPETVTQDLMKDIEHSVDTIQVAASEALANLLAVQTSQVEPTLIMLLKLYRDRLGMIPAKLDEFGREIEKPRDIWYPRKGVALAIGQLAPLVRIDFVGELMQFFVFTSLSDRNDTVQKEMLNAALRIVDLHGKDTVGTLWPVFDNFMRSSSKASHYDVVKQAVVVLMGSLARHLEKDDPRVKPIVQRLIQALSTPSQTVQDAVANCLPALINSVKEEAPGYINKLLHQLLKGDKYGERKGAAYGLAGIVKGMGILSLRQYDIMTKLTDAIQDKKNYKLREGALFAIEMLFQMLGKLFEPYIVYVLPHLLQCFGDSSQYVRAAAVDTAKVVMNKLSGHGVKLVLPSLLNALEEDSWRTKTGSVELLGAMAYCAPKQLSSCLPNIVPKLIEVLSDSHMKVQEAGAAALKVIGSVIRNPEIQAIVPILLRALQDPSNKTSVCLQTLLDTKFVHFIDAPSLALIMPVVQRAFMDRATETRKMAAQIIGNMYSLTDQKDLLPYLPTIIPGLKASLLDPVPEVRSVSARALGAMVKGIGESTFEDLMPWLMQTLTSESSSVDRSGAAQGLSEVVGGLGVEKLHKLMPEIISTAERTDIAPHVKDGYIMMFIYMPVVFTEEFTPYIGQIITPILKALADENEYVRETALKAGQRIVNLYAESAILLLLPELEKGLFDDNWRIRYSSVQLLGDLLYRISGVTGKMSTETASEDDNFGTEQSHLAIINTLGSDRRNRVLAGLYMGRSDVALMVRQAALHVWKVVVTNTPRTLREILPTLFGLLLGCLASESYDKRQVAARTLGDLVRKLGERVLPEIIPILEQGLQSDQADQRQGVCIGLSEIMASTSRDMVLTFVNSLVPTVRTALCDPLPEVRQAAAKTFDSLHSTVGAKALDDILPALLNQLNDEDPEVAEFSLDGLRQVMAIKSRVVLPYLIPQLTASPANTKALSILASVAGESLNKYLPKILPALQTTLATLKGTPEEQHQLEYCQAVVLSVTDETGIRTVIDTMLENSRNEDPAQRRAAATLLCAFCANSKAQYTSHVPQLLRGLIHLCTDSDKDVLLMSWEALNAVTKSLEQKQLPTYVSDVRQAVRFAMSDMKGTSDTLPGFCLPKGLAPVLPIFREAILNGDGDEKEVAALGLGEVIKVTSAIALQPSVITITGPLIRILGDRFAANVKTAVLEALSILLSKVGAQLKQFLPQLQTTFLKSLYDPNRAVRLAAAAALSYLIGITQRSDPIFLELHNIIKNNEDVSIKETALHALRGCIINSGDKISIAIKKQMLATLLTYLGQPEDTLRKCAAGCIGSLCKYLEPDQFDTLLSEHLLCDVNSVNGTLKEGRACALTVALKDSPKLLWDEQYRSQLIQTLLSQLQSNSFNVTQSGIRSCGYLLQYLLVVQEAAPNNLLVPFVRTMNNNSNDIKQLMAKVCHHLGKVTPQEKWTSEMLKLLLPTLVNGTKEKNMYVKANSELALVAVLRLKESDTMYQKCSAILDVGARESLSDVVNKVLRKMINQPEGKDSGLDDTLLT